jgi:peptidoglycan/LPS O-acetylase OafA/YrhL
MISKKKYYPQLDAIRGISVLAVFFYHAYKPAEGTYLIQKFWVFVCSKMHLGLDVFFILSAFLLTLLGINEYQKNKNFSFKNYFIRRALRIWPLYYLLMFFSFVILPLVQQYTGQQITLPPAPWYLFFVSNFYLQGHVFFLRLLWTLSVEEQFYLIWGLCLLLFQKYLGLVILILATASVVFNLVATAQGIEIYFHTLTYLIDMMVGAFAALSIQKNNFIIKFARSFAGVKSYLFYFFLPLLLIIYFILDKAVTGISNDLLSVTFRFIFIIYCGVVIIDQMINVKPVVNLANTKFLIYTGKISYSLYSYHGVVITAGLIIVQKNHIVLPSLIQAIILLAATFGVASFSYIFIEKPFLKIKDKLSRV